MSTSKREEDAIASLFGMKMSTQALLEAANNMSDDEDGGVVFSCSALPQGTDLTRPNAYHALFIRSNFHRSLVEMEVMFDDNASAIKLVHAIRADTGDNGYDLRITLRLCYHDNNEQVMLNKIGKHRKGEKMQVLTTNHQSGYYLSNTTYSFANTHDASPRPFRNTPAGARPKQIVDKIWNEQVKTAMMLDFEHPVTYRANEFLTAEYNGNSVIIQAKVTGNVTSQWHTVKRGGQTRIFYWRAEIEAPTFHKVLYRFYRLPVTPPLTNCSSQVAKSNPVVFYANDVNRVNVPATDGTSTRDANIGKKRPVPDAAAQNPRPSKQSPPPAMNEQSPLTVIKNSPPPVTKEQIPSPATDIKNVVEDAEEIPYPEIPSHCGILLLSGPNPQPVD